MEPITLITTALTLAAPFLKKTGEKVAEGIGEDIWKLLNKPFIKVGESPQIEQLAEEDKIEEIKSLLLLHVENDNNFKEEVIIAIKAAEEKLGNSNQQNVNNNDKVEKQINIQNNSGTINF
jgi:hypothetical protein